MAVRLGASWFSPWRLLTACLVLLFTCLAAGADDGDKAKAKSEPPVELKATEIGVRFTPAMARAMGKKFLEEMKSQYDLDDGQVQAMQNIVSVQLIEFASENAEAGRAVIEKMIETGIEHEGRFPKESAQELARLAKPLIPALKGFFTESAGKIGKEMTIKQRLKFTGDMAKVTAGLVVFENRMKRWEEGKVGKNANPFYDPADEDPSKADTEPEDPDEHPEHRRARREIERWIDWQIDVDRQWEHYVNRASEYYGFSESQKTGAEAILKDCLERVKRIKTPELRTALTENRIAQRLGWGLGPDISQGPWMFTLEAEFQKLRKPLTDLEREFKRRINTLPDSQQRAAAQDRVRKALAEKGVKKPPL